MSGAFERILATLGQSERDADLAAVVAALGDGHADSETIWRVVAAANAGCPTVSDVLRFSRDLIVAGPAEAVARLAKDIDRVSGDVEFAADAILLDVSGAFDAPGRSGIRRLASRLAQEWGDDGAVLVRWTDAGQLRRITPDERQTVLAGPEIAPPIREDRGAFVRPDEPAFDAIVPVSGALVLIGPVTAGPATERIKAIGRFSAVRVHAIVSDFSPFAASEYVSDDAAAGFPLYLEAIGRADSVLAVSGSLARELVGWKRMLPSSGLAGPEIVTIPLPSELPGSWERGTAGFSALAGTASEPLVLVVGDHSPQKNHARILQAAELLWRAGRRFRVVVIATDTDARSRVEDAGRGILSAGRPVRFVSGVSDDVLAAAYRESAFTVFPSLHEGFGLPLAESLAAGTPVITSDRGALRELAAGGGAVMIEPEATDALVATMDRLLSNPAELQALTRAAAAREGTSWADWVVAVREAVAA